MSDVSGIKASTGYKGLSDVNGDGKKDKKDIKKIQKYISKKAYYDSMPDHANEYDSDFKKAADVNGDRVVDGKDLSYYENKNYSGSNVADINGDKKTDSKDIKKIQEYVSKKAYYDSMPDHANEYDSDFKYKADINGDGKVDSKDIKIITTSDAKEVLEIEIKKKKDLLNRVKATNHINYDVKTGKYIKTGGQMGANVVTHYANNPTNYLTDQEKKALIKEYGSLDAAETGLQNTIDESYLNLVDTEGNVALKTYEKVLKGNKSTKKLNNEESLKLSKKVNNTQIDLYKEQKEEYEKIKNDSNASDEEKSEASKKIEIIDKQIKVLENSNDELDKEIKIESYEKVRDESEYKDYTHTTSYIEVGTVIQGGVNFVPDYNLKDDQNPFDYLENIKRRTGYAFVYTDTPFTTDKYNELKEKYESLNYLTKEELKTYNYIFEKDGRERAEEYWEILLDRVNQRKGLKEAIDFYKTLEKCETMDNEELKKELINFYVNTLNKTKEEAEKEAKKVLEKASLTSGNIAKVIGECLGDGILSCLEGINNIGNMSTARTELEYKQMYIAAMLESNGFLSFTGKLSSIAGSMLPAILASAATSFAATPIAGAEAAATLAQIMSGSIIFLSSFGNATHDARCNGHDILISTLYGVLKGMTDATLKTTLGSILGPKSTNIVTHLIREGLADAAITYVTGGLKATVLGEKVDLGELNAEAAEAFLYGVLMAGIFKATDKVSEKIVLLINGKEYEVTEEQLSNALEENSKVDTETGGETKYTAEELVKKVLKIKEKVDGVVKKVGKSDDDEEDEEYDPETIIYNIDEGNIIVDYKEVFGITGEDWAKLTVKEKIKLIEKTKIIVESKV